MPRKKRISSINERQLNFSIFGGTLADKPEKVEVSSADNEPDWSQQCDCGATPVHPISGMCGPCTFGEAATAGGNW